MATTASAALIAELDGAVDSRSPERWAEILRQVTLLFLADADRLDESQIAVFDDVFLRLIERVDVRAQAALSNSLSGIGSAPRNAVHRLALHNDLLVAGPVLRKSSSLLEKDLVEIASARSQEHLLEMSSRQTVNTSLSDVLMKRGERAVLDKLIQNLGARFTEAGYVGLVEKAKRDEGLAEKLVRRSDVPPELRHGLVAKVSDARMRFLRTVSPALQEKIQAAIATTAERAGVSAPIPVDYSAAIGKMAELSRKGKLNDSSVNRFAVEHEYVDVVAALSFLSGTPVGVIVPLIKSAELDGLMVACKAARLNWSTTT